MTNNVTYQTTVGYFFVSSSGSILVVEVTINLLHVGTDHFTKLRFHVFAIIRINVFGRTTPKQR